MIGRQTRRNFAFGLAAGSMAAAMFPSAAVAQAYPTRQIRIVVPYTPGGITDVVTRLIGEQLATTLGQSVIIENKPGANSLIGADQVAKSAPDGHTLVMVIGAHAANATLYAGRIPFDPVADFAPISLVGVAPLVMAVSNNVPAKTLPEFIAYAKANPGKLNYASSGVGAAAHLTMEDLKRRAGLDMVHVPYRGTGPALTDLMAGNVGAMIDTQLGLKPQIDAGAIRGLFIAGEKRSPTMPDLPTAIEGGMPGFVSSTWTLLMAPGKTPSAIVDRLAAEVAKAVKNPTVAAKLSELGVEIVGNGPVEATAFLKGEVAKWGTVIRDANVKLEQ